MSKKVILSAILCVCTLASAFASDFSEINSYGVVIYYDITSDTTVSVAQAPSGEAYEGTVSIPSSASNGETNYSVTSIGWEAFLDCSSLTSVTIPNSVTSIGVAAFAYCSSLASVTIPNSVTSIGASTFRGCSSLTSVTIPNSVTSIGEEAFRDCSSLASVTIPNSVTSIGDYAFFDCYSLTSVTIPNSVTSIGEEAFRNCSSLTSVTIPNSVTSIGDYAFFDCYSLTSVTIPNSVTSIGDHAFYNCSSLASITIPNSVTSIGDYAFFECSSLASVTIPNSVTSIGSSTFMDCSGLTSVTIPNSVTSIGNYTFVGCSSLASVTIPNSVTSIGNYAFYDCSGLASATFLRPEPPGLGAEPFRDVPLENVTVFVPSESIDKYMAAYSFLSEAKNVGAHVTGISLDQQVSSLKTGDVVLLSADVQPDDAFDKTVTWRSNNESVATVDQNGKVTVAGVGTAAIIATTNNLNKSDTCIITATAFNKSSDAALKTLVVNGDTVPLEAGTFEYQVRLPYGETEVTIKASANDRKAAVSSEDTTYSSIHVGDTVFTVAVTAEDESITQTYRVHVRRLSGGATLKSITVNDTPVPDFHPNTLRYSVNVINSTKTVTVKGTPNHPAGSVDGEVENRPVSVGRSIDFYIDGVAEDKSYKKYYTVTVTRLEASRDATLQSITVNGQPLQGFRPDSFAYSLIVGSDMESITVGHECSHQGASASVEGANSLKVGDTNTVTVTVTAEFKFSTNTYTINVKRLSGDASLGSVFINGSPLSGPCYRESVADTVSSITVSAQASHERATVKGEGTYQLDFGENEIPIYVTAEDTTKKRVFVLTVTRENSFIPSSAGTIDGESVKVYTSNKTLHISSPSAETVNIYTLTGKLLYGIQKPAGATSLTVHHPQGILIVRGSSGWIRKLII